MNFSREFSVKTRSQVSVVGQVTLRVWRDSFECLLDCKLVDSLRFQSSHVSGDTLRTDREKGASHSFDCERFDTYIYERDVVTVETDHKPLESIVLKPL